MVIEGGELGNWRIGDWRLEIQDSASQPPSICIADVPLIVVERAAA